MARMNKIEDFTNLYAIYDRQTRRYVDGTLATNRSTTRFNAIIMNNGSNSRARRYVPVSLRPQRA